MSNMNIYEKFEYLEKKGWKYVELIGLNAEKRWKYRFYPPSSDGNDWSADTDLESLIDFVYSKREKEEENV